MRYAAYIYVRLCGLFECLCFIGAVKGIICESLFYQRSVLTYIWSSVDDNSSYVSIVQITPKLISVYIT